MTTIDDLHAELFGGYVPAKGGEAYERLAALVLAVLGWEDVVQDARVTAKGKLAEHALDVTARDPNGEIERLTLECKDWNTEVGKGTLDTLVGVRTQIGGAAAVVTTKGLTDGARRVATDERISMLLLRPYDTNDPTPYVKKITLTINPLVPSVSELRVETDDGVGLPGGESLPRDARLLCRDGSPAESIMEVLESNAGPLAEGEHACSAAFPNGRLLPLASGGTVAIRAMAWTETVVAGEPTVIENEAVGEPKLVLQELDEHGDVKEGRVVVDDELYAWQIDAAGNVVRQRELRPD